MKTIYIGIHKIRDYDNIYFSNRGKTLANLHVNKKHITPCTENDYLFSIHMYEQMIQNP